MSKSQFVGVIPFNDNFILFLKSMWICLHIKTRLTDIHSVHSFYVECVVLMSRVAPTKQIKCRKQRLIHRIV